MTAKKTFGVGFNGEKDVSKTLKHVKQAEELGYNACWIAEDYFYGGAFTMATACAADTESINIGIGVLNPFTRHPALTAMEAAALYSYSKGRFSLGLGASNTVWLETQMGIPFKKVLPSLRECIHILRRMFKGEKVSFSGEVFNISNVELKLDSCPELPIIMGVKSEKMLHMAGELADGVILSIGTSVPYVKWVKERLSEGAVQSGRSLDNFSIAAYLLIIVDEDREKARALTKEKLAYIVGLHGDHPIMRIAGLDKEQLLLFREGFINGKPRADLVTDEIIDRLAIAGTKEECRSRLKDLLDAGITQPILFDFSLIPMEENMRIVKENFFDMLD